MIYKTPFVEQMQQTECGLCCMAMVAGHYKSYYSLTELREIAGPGRDGVSLYYLAQLGKHIGFETKSYKVSLEQLALIHLPAIAFWNSNHYVVIDKVSNGKVWFIDPSIGRQKKSLEEFGANFRGVVLELIPTEAVKKRKPKPVWKPFLRYLSKAPFIVLFVLLLSVVLQFITIGIPMLVQFLIDDILISYQINLLDLFIIGIVGIILVQGIFQFVRGKLIITLNNLLDREMMEDFFSHILKLPYQFFQLRSFGDLLFRATSLRIVRDMMSSQIIKGVLDVGSIIIILIYMFSKSLMLGTVVVILALVNVFVSVIARPKIREVNQEEIGKNSNLQAYQTEFLYGIFGIKTAGIENETYKKWSTHLDELISAFKKKEGLLNIINTISSTLILLSPLLILWIGAKLYFDGRLSIGELVAFHSLSNQFFAMSGSIVQTINSVFLTTSYLQRIQDVLDSPIERSGKNDFSDDILKGDITISNVSFRYSKHSPDVIKNVSLSIKNGQKIAIIGKSGSGKSTLAKLILGLYIPSQGEILFNGRNIKELDLSKVRKQMGVVPQDVTLFNRSIKDNIALYNNDIGMEMIEESSKMAQIHDDIMAMPMKYNTMVSELGMNLSGGQRQRVALARALLNKPSIILLDEATSSLDHQYERRIDKYLDELNCTRVVIAHKLTTIMNSDQIIVMNEGEIIAAGTHEELLQSNEFYGTFYQKFHESKVAVSN